jgi:hypothetical protein
MEKLGKHLEGEIESEENYCADPYTREREVKMLGKSPMSNQVNAYENENTNTRLWPRPTPDHGGKCSAFCICLKVQLVRLSVTTTGFHLPSPLLIP